ncbi:N-6 DNA methylase [Chitinibacter sp. GC72]|uniref:N-6 DNA methylase n=1 Tax=Chitinibacter sp. GC72 TaxID=1526917 RepID=UPI0012FCD440|nr:N-6 DNA methylase [Chitinibacter sp. GC72]
MPPKKKIDVKQPSLGLGLQEKNPKEAFRNIRNYLAGQFVGATRDDSLLDEVLKCLFCKLVIERGELPPVDLTAQPFELSKQIRSVFATVRSDFPEIYTEESEILLDPASLKFVMQELNFSIMDSESDPIGDAFEVFVGSESRGNSGQFFTPRSVTNLLVAAVNPQPHETVLDPACGAGGFLASVCAHRQRHGVPIENLASGLYGIDKDSYLAQLAKVHISLLTGGHPTVLNGDSVSLQNGSKNLREYLPKNGLDVILTNPPFGAKIIAANPEVISTFDLAKKWTKNKKTGVIEPGDKVSTNVPPQVLFVERCLSLLRPGGRLGMVLPESILSNKSYRHVVEYLLLHTEIHAVMGMPEALFKTSGKGGTHTKTCLLVATKRSDGNTKPGKIFMAEAKWCGQDSRARVIPNNDLPEILQKFEYFRRQGKINEASSLGFLTETAQVTGGVLCPRYYDPQAEHELAGLEETHKLLKVQELIAEGVLSLTTGDEVGKLAYGTGTIPFIRTSDISNWEIKSDPKHGVSREIYESLAKKQDVQAGDVLMVKDGTYLIGTCAIVTEADKQILYQSHLYKIRVNQNTHGLNSFLLLAILSSSAVQKQIRSKQFTQDIIDSLGERINELILPVPLDIVKRDLITEQVRLAVVKRGEAKELARLARDSVCC